MNSIDCAGTSLMLLLLAWLFKVRYAKAAIMDSNQMHQFFIIFNYLCINVWMLKFSSKSILKNIFVKNTILMKQKNLTHKK